MLRLILLLGTPTGMEGSHGGEKAEEVRNAADRGAVGEHQGLGDARKHDSGDREDAWRSREHGVQMEERA